MGYSNVAGDLNVYSDTSTSTLTVRSGASFAGGLTATGVSNFANLVASNLTVTNAFIVTATNTQVSNSLYINNFGTTTALFVNQNEFPAMVHNVAEFWDHTQLAMVIDPNGNVAIHTSASPGYALTVSQAASIDTLTLGTPLAVSSGGTGTATAGQNTVFAGPTIGTAAPTFRALTSSDLPSSISVSNIFANGFGLSNLSGANVFGNVAQATLALVVSQASQPNITSVGTLTSLTVSGILNANLYTGNASGLSNITGSNVTGNVANANVALVVSQASQPNITSVGTLTSLNVSGTSNLTTLVSPLSNIVTLNVTSAIGTFYGPHAGLNVASFSNIYVANSVATTNITASGNVTVGPTPANILANLHVEQGDVFIGNSAIVGTNFATTGPVNRLIFDNSANTSVIPNKIVLFANAAAQAYCGLSMASGTDVLYHARTNHRFLTGVPPTTEVMRINTSGVVGIGTASGQAKLSVYGVITNTNTSVRIDSSNLALVTTGGGLVGINTLTPSANLHVIGNVYASNALSTNDIFSNTLSVTSLIAGPITGSNVASFLNVYSANALTTTNVVYSLDVIAQGPYLNPSTANASIITQWYTRLVNTTTQPFWSVSASPQFSYINTSNLVGYVAQTLLADGRVLFNQISGNNIGFFYPDVNQFTYVTGVTINGYDYSGVIQIPDGRVVFIPLNGNKVGLLNPTNFAFTTVSTGTAISNMHYGAVYEPTGNVIMTPTNSSNVGIFNTNTGAYSRVSFASEIPLNTVPIYNGSVLLPDGRVVFIPNQTSNVGVYTPSTATYSNVTVTVSGKYAGGCLMPDGNVFMVPNGASSNACIYNPNLNTVSNVAGLSGSVGGGNGVYSGAVAFPDGRILLMPALNNNSGANGFIIYNYKTGAISTISGLPGNTMYQNSALIGGGTLIPDGRVIFTTQYGAGLLNFRTPAPREFCLHPFFNKF